MASRGLASPFSRLNSQYHPPSAPRPFLECVTPIEYVTRLVVIYARNASGASGTHLIYTRPCPCVSCTRKGIVCHREPPLDRVLAYQSPRYGALWRCLRHSKRAIKGGIKATQLLDDSTQEADSEFENSSIRIARYMYIGLSDRFKEWAQCIGEDADGFWSVLQL